MMMREATGIPWPNRPMWLLIVAVAATACSGAGPVDNGTPPPPPPPSPPPAGAQYDVGYVTYFGGSDQEEMREPIPLSGGRLLFGARTRSANAPTTAGAFQRTHGGGQSDSYVGIFSGDGSILEAGTFFGGSGMERPPYGMAITSSGDIVFTSGTASPNLPTSSTSYRPDLHPTPLPGVGDGYVCRISGDLRAMRWCTYTGGGWPRGGLAVDAQDNVIVVGNAYASSIFATTTGVVQAQARGATDAFVLKLSADGRQAIWSTRLGGTEPTGSPPPVEVAASARVYPNGDVSVVGVSQSANFPTTPGSPQTQSTGPDDAFAVRLSASGATLLKSTLLGGSAGDGPGHPHVLLPDGSIVFAGQTGSSDLPFASGSRRGSNDGFVAKLNAAGTAFEFVRYLGGSGTEHILGPAVDAQGRIYVVGSTTSQDLAVTSDAVQSKYQGGPDDGVLWVLDPDGSIRYATYLGGSGSDLIRGVAVGPGGEIYLVGGTDSDDLPVTPNAFQRSRRGNTEGFAIKLVPR